MDFGIVMNMLLMACGIYMIYWAVQMKSTKIVPQMLIGNGISIERAKDPLGYIKAIFPFTLIMGIVLLVVGLVEGLGLCIQYPIVDSLLMIGMVLLLVLYGMFLLKAQKKYLIGLVDNKKKR